MKYFTTTQIRQMLGYESQQTVIRRARACGIVPDMVGGAYCYNEEQVQQIRDYRFPARTHTAISNDAHTIQECPLCAIM